MTLKNLMKLYSNAKAIDTAFDGKGASFFEQLDDFSMWTDLKENVNTQTAEQKELIGNEVAALFPVSVSGAKNSGFDNAKEFFEAVLAFPEVVCRNRQKLCWLLRDLKKRLEKNMQDDSFCVTKDDLCKLFKKAKEYDI